MKFTHIVIVGTGTMGTDLSVKLSVGGERVTVVGRSGGSIDSFWTRAGHTASDMGVDLNTDLLRLVTNVTDVEWQDVDLVIENVREDLDIKRSVFRELCSLAPADAVITSNSSTFGISKITEGLENPRRFLGLHFFMPAHLVPLVEIVMSTETDSKLSQDLKGSLKQLGFVPVIVKKDVPGFLANRIQAAMMREVWHVLENDIASPEDVDTAVTFGFGCRLLAAGPVLQKEISGLDVTYLANKNVFPDLSVETTPPPVLEEKVLGGNIGMKSGNGFWHWDENKKSEVRRQYISKLKASVKVLSED